MSCGTSNASSAPAYKIREGTNHPALEVQLYGAGSLTPLDLTNAAGVTFYAKSTDGLTTITGACSVTDAVNGKVQYDWQDGDTDVPGDYPFWVVVTWVGGGTTAVPEDMGDALRFRITQDP